MIIRIHLILTLTKTQQAVCFKMGCHGGGLSSLSWSFDSFYLQTVAVRCTAPLSELPVWSFTENHALLPPDDPQRWSSRFMQGLLSVWITTQEGEGVGEKNRRH